MTNWNMDWTKVPDLRGCPWCKKTPKLEQDFDDSWHVCCAFEHCAVKPITHGYRRAQEAAQVWNCCEQPDLMPRPIS